MRLFSRGFIFLHADKLHHFMHIDVSAADANLAS